METPPASVQGGEYQDIEWIGSGELVFKGQLTTIEQSDNT